MDEKKKTKSISEKEKWQLVKGLSDQFIQRQDLYARQLDDGRYLCLHKAFHQGLMYQHLCGKITLGVYLLDRESRARFTVLDADTDEVFKKLLIAAQDLDRLHVPCYLESSRRGGHMWLFFGNPLAGEKARNFGKGIAKAYGLGDIEVFPKQGETSGKPGSLIRMPFGVHRKSGQRYWFITSKGQPLGTTLKQLETMCHPDTIPGEAVEMFQYREPITRYRSGQGHERLRAVPLISFLENYMELRPTSSGAVGLCPFHDDQQASFGVNARGNYWNCFAGCGGGDIISFWMKFKNCDYPTAVRELEEVLYGHAIG